MGFSQRKSAEFARIVEIPFTMHTLKKSPILRSWKLQHLGNHSPKMPRPCNGKKRDAAGAVMISVSKAPSRCHCATSSGSDAFVEARTLVFVFCVGNLDPPAAMGKERVCSHVWHGKGLPLVLCLILYASWGPIF